MASIEATNAPGHLSSAIRQLTKTQTKKVLLALVQDTYDSPDDLKQILEPFIFDRLSHHIQVAIDEARLSPVPDNVMEQELEAVDSLLESYAKFADKKLLSDVTVKMNDLFVILQSRAKDQKWQAEVQQRVNKLNLIRGKDFPDPTIFNTGYQKRGWMDKRTHTFKGWKRRWFVLKGTHLTYFEKTEPSSIASADWGEVTYEGILRKKKQGKGWKTRWAQIRPEGLLYFKSQKDKDPIGALPFAECERIENPAEKSFEVTYNGVKYYFTVEHDDEFTAWSHAFAGVCPELSHDPNMATFTIRGVIDLATSILDDKNNDKPYCFTITVEGGKTFVFAVDSDRQKQEWLNLIGAVVKTDNSTARRNRSITTGNGNGLLLKQASMSFDKAGSNAPDSPAPTRFAFKDDVIGRPLSVRQEGESFDAKFQTAEEPSDDDEEEKEEGEEAARERTKIVRRDTIKLIRTFKLEVHLEDQRDIFTFAFDNSVLVDQVKSYLFKHIPVLAGCNQADYSLGVDADDLLTVEFLRFVSSNTFIEVAVRTCGIARVGLYLRDNLRKITEQRAARTRPLKTTHEIMAQADQQRMELEYKLQVERTERERLEHELKEKAATEKRLLAEKLAREREFQEKSLQAEMRTYTTAATQTDDAPQPSGGSSDKISWRSHNSQVALPSSIAAKKAESMLKAASVPSGLGSSSNLAASTDGKPKTMITKTNPRSTASGWQQVQPSPSATKRPMIVPCEGWSIEVPGEPLPVPSIKSWQFSIAMDNSLSETPEPFFYRKYFITAKKTTNFLGSDPKYGAISFSMCSNPDGYRGVLFTKLGTRQISIVPTALKMQPTTLKSRKQQMLQFLLSKMESSINPKNLRISVHPDMQKELLSLEERQVCSGFKFGVVYAKGGQTEENELFNNENGSEEWNEFLELLGSRVPLKGWAQYNAGLDVKSNTTGTHSLYTNWKGNEIMFHVSTMLPFHPEDPQKLERKRHVGNDICVIVFQEGATPYLPSTITSHFNHIVAVVHYDKAVGGFRLGFAFKDGVPAFGPVLNSHGFVKKADLKELLLTKLINGEAASLLAPVFAQKLVRTREALLNYYLQQFL